MTDSINAMRQDKSRRAYLAARNPDHEQIYSHSTLVYWWPVWLVGYIAAFWTNARGGWVSQDVVRQDPQSLSSAPGLMFIGVLLFVIIFTNLRLRGIYSLATVFALAFIFVLFAWLNWWDAIVAYIPQLAIHMNLGFYLVFSTLLLAIWLLSFFVFDRLTFWRVQPGQMTEEHLIGGGERSYDTRGMVFEQHGDDIFRHIVLGLGAGDLKLTTAGAKSETIEIPNVLFANRKVKNMQRLAAVTPNKPEAEAR